MNKQQDRRVIRTTRHEFPKDPEKRLENMLYIVNTEPKIITVGFCLEDSVPKTQCHLQKSFLELAEGHWTPHPASFRAYCEQTLLPAGVAEELIISEGRTTPSIGWRLTEEGNKYARPIAAFALKHAVDNNISMCTLLGSINSRGDRRAPYNRFLILDSLRDREPKREVDIATNINSDPECIRRHLEKLKNVGLVSYDSVGAESSGWAIYSWIDGRNPEDVEIVGHRKSLTKDIANHLKRLGKSERNEIAKLVNYTASSVSNILGGLERQGFIKPDRWIGGHIQSEARITDAGFDFLHNLDRIRNAEGSELEYMENILDEFYSDRDMLAYYVGKAMELYRNMAAYQKRKTASQHEEEILETVRNYQNRNGYGPRTGEINKILEFKLYRYLGDLTRKGKLDRKKKGREVRYTILS